MRKTVAVIALALTLALCVATPAKTYHHHQESLHGVAGNISDTDAWRHFLLHVAANLPTITLPSNLDNDFRALYNTAWKFRAEFEKAIDDFNATQETRTEADQLAALKNFIVQRDAMVESHQRELLSALTPQRRTETEKEFEKSKPGIKSTGAGPATGKSCGFPDVITCSITYSMYPVFGGQNADHHRTFGWNQILDGAASMVGNSQHAHHTPTVKMTIDGGTEHNNSGKSVCADCYLYVNANVSFVLTPGGQSEAIGEGIVVCSDAGKFFYTRANSE
jgi:hypothetical protein